MKVLEGPASVVQITATVVTYAIEKHHKMPLGSPERQAWKMVAEVPSQDLQELLKDCKTRWGGIERITKEVRAYAEAKKGL